MKSQLMSQTRGRHSIRSLILSNSHFVAISQQIEEELRALGCSRRTIGPICQWHRRRGVRARRVAARVTVACAAPRDLPRSTASAEEPRRALAGLAACSQPMSCRQAAAGWRRTAATGTRTTGRRTAVETHACTSSGHKANPLPYLQASDLFVLPSISEGMSNSLLEAMACGLPSVVSSAGGNVDLIQDGQAGLVADATTPTDLADQLVRMLDDSTLRHRCGAACATASSASSIRSSRSSIGTKRCTATGGGDRADRTDRTHGTDHVLLVPSVPSVPSFRTCQLVGAVPSWTCDHHASSCGRLQNLANGMSSLWPAASGADKHRRWHRCRH